MEATSKVAIVTGAARGIGRAIALKLASDGCKVVVNYVADRTSADSLVAELNASGHEAFALKGDVSQREDCRALVEATLTRWGQVDILINNAGVAGSGTPLADVAVDIWQRMLEVNVHGSIHMIQAVIPHMRARRSGNIVNLSSNVTARMPATFGPYTMSKAAIEAMTRILAKEEGPHGIRVNAVAPGPIMTDMLARLLETMGEERAQAFVNSVPLRRTGKPEEIAAIVAMLCSDVASFLTGEVVYVNGGGPGG